MATGAREHTFGKTACVTSVCVLEEIVSVIDPDDGGPDTWSALCIFHKLSVTFDEQTAWYRDGEETGRERPVESVFVREGVDDSGQAIKPQRRRFRAVVYVRVKMSSICS
jgi:hypothetical protein